MSAKPGAFSPNTDSLLRIKLMSPRLHSTMIQRTNLLARLDECLTKKLVIVEAPTGFGKTTLVGQWIASREFKSAWVTLDQNDNDPARFWTYVASALRTFDSTVGKSTLSALMTPQPPSFEILLAPLINDLTRLPMNSVLVLEDYHAITSTEIKEGLSFLIQHLPEMLHVVVISRNEPDLPLGILRARDEMIEISVSDLRFDRMETESFLRENLQANLSLSTVEKIFQKTEGWPAGLRLVALSLKSKGGAIENLIESISGSDRYIADYLIQEVFESQPEVTQIFLLKTCFLNRLTGSLCDSVTGSANGVERLAELERENLFLVQLESSGGRIWYRYNPLFAESIQALAGQRLGEDGVRSIFEKASAWYDQQQLYDDAIETALAAKSFDRVLTLIEKFIERHDLNEFRTLGRWLENIPAQEILSRPMICFTYAQVILYSADRFAPSTATRIEPLLRAVETAWRAQENHQGLGEVLAFRANVSLWQGDFSKAFDLARQSLEKLPEHDVLYRGNSLLILSHESLNAGKMIQTQDRALEARALLGAAQNIYGVLAALQVLAEIFYWQGELEQAEQLNQQILEEAVGEISMLDDQGVASLNLARIAYERNDLEQANQLAMHALDLAEQRNNEMLRVQSTIQMAYLHAARNEFSQAHELLNSLTAKIQIPNLLRAIQETQARLSILSGDLSSLTSWQTLISNRDQNVLPVQREREDFTLARLCIAEDKLKDAYELIGRWRADAAENGRVRSQIEALCLEALTHHADSNLSQATQSLIEVLALGHAGDFRRIFLDEGPRFASLLQAVLPSLPNRSLGLFATALLHSFSPEMTAHLTASRSTVQVDALSQQELRVLRLLVAGMSNADIAKELIVSTNTIKTHVKSIYRKLNISSRDEAREMAKELKLL